MGDWRGKNPARNEARNPLGKKIISNPPPLLGGISPNIRLCDLQEGKRAHLTRVVQRSPLDVLNGVGIRQKPSKSLLSRKNVFALKLGLGLKGKGTLVCEEKIKNALWITPAPVFQIAR